jgi:hypothetical protein
MADEKAPVQTEDVPVSSETADEIKGGAFPPEPIGADTRGLTGHKSKRATPKRPGRPLRAMPHE